MYIVVEDRNRFKQYINTEHIQAFYCDGALTRILLDRTYVEVIGDCTKQLAEVIRKTGVGIKQIGD